VIPNGVDVGSIHDVVTRLDRRRKREELGFFGDEIVLGNVARLQPAKGHTYLLESFAEVLKQEPRARLIAVGWGELEQPLRDKAVALGISHATQFLGRRLDVKELLGAMDAFVFSSIHEGQGIAILEAMAARLPIAATDVDGIPDMIRHEDTGLLVPPRDADALAAATLRLIRDKSLAQSLGRNAHAVAKAEFSIAPIGQRYEELYESLLGQRSPPHWS
jgi:glycosyltransferase involved in cell wall biosynthesis